jgi:hypothetical protein
MEYFCEHCGHKYSHDWWCPARDSDERGTIGEADDSAGRNAASPEGGPNV